MIPFKENECLSIEVKSFLLKINLILYIIHKILLMIKKASGRVSEAFFNHLNDGEFYQYDQA